MGEKVGIARVFLNDVLPPERRADLVDLTMTLHDRGLFHDNLKESGVYVGEGRRGQIDESGEMGTIFSIYILDNGKRTNQKVGEITTFSLDMD